MIVTTTHELHGHTIREYLGIVVGESIRGRGPRGSLRDLVGGRSKSFEEKMTEAREIAIKEMVAKAEALGADAVVGVDIDYGTVASMMMVSASGTAVKTG